MIPKFRKKVLMCFLSLSCIFTLFNFNLINVNAENSASISASKSSVAPGESFTVTVSANGGTFKVNQISVSNGSASASSLDMIENGSLSFTVTAGTVGTVSISVNGPFATFVPEAEETITRSVSVSVVTPTQNPGGSSSGGGSQTPEQPNTPTEKKSSDANLSALSISSGELNPVFSADVTNYSVTLGKDVTSISVEAKANDAKASVSGTGEQTLKAGKNEISVHCTAEDGTIKTYAIVVNVDETPDTFVEYNGSKLGVVKNLDDVKAPEGFESTKVTFNGSEIDAWVNNLSKLTIVYMIDDKNEKNFYLYDTENKVITSVYKPIALLGKNVALIDIPEELQKRSGMLFGEVEVDQQKMQGWTFENKAFENYVLIYVLDDKGQARYYLYEKSENTLQLFSGAAALTQDDYELLISEHDTALQQRMWMIFALLATNVITIILLLVVILKRKKRKSLRKVEAPKKLQSQNIEEDVDIIEENDDEDTSLHIIPFQNESQLFHEEDENAEIPDINNDENH